MEGRGEGRDGGPARGTEKGWKPGMGERKTRRTRPGKCMEMYSREQKRAEGETKRRGEADRETEKQRARGKMGGPRQANEEHEEGGRRWRWKKEGWQKLRPGCWRYYKGWKADATLSPRNYTRFFQLALPEAAAVFYPCQNASTRSTSRCSDFSFAFYRLPFASDRFIRVIAASSSNCTD